MFWITFIVSGLTIASLPWVASNFSNTVAGYVLLVPVMLTAGLVVQYLHNDAESTVEMIKSSLWALPTLLVFGLIAIATLKNEFHLVLVVGLSLLGWLLSMLLVNFFRS